MRFAKGSLDRLAIPEICTIINLRGHETALPGLEAEMARPFSDGAKKPENSGLPSN